MTTEIRELLELAAQVEGLRKLIERCSRIMKGGETDDQGEAYDLVHKLLDDSIEQEKSK